MLAELGSPVGIVMASARRVPYTVWLAVAGVCVGVAAIVGPAASPAWGDVVRLKDGKTLRGDLQKTADGWIVTQSDGKQVLVASDRVASIEATPRADVAAERLGSIRRAAENVVDPKVVLDWYRAFVLKYPGTPAADQAKAEMPIWEERVARKLVKVAGRWADEGERRQIGEQSFVTAEQAFEQLRLGKTVEAGELADRAIAENGSNAAAWYIKGLASWKADRAPDARKAFERVVELLPDHAPSHNNLAVVLWRQNQQVAALLSYDKALAVAPQSRFVLDNLAEALAALPSDLRERTTVGRVVRHFNDDDALLQRQMAARFDLHRWGATWISRADLEKFRAAEKEVRGRIDRLEVDFNAVSVRLQRIDADIASAERTMRQIESNSVAFDVTGRLVRHPLPPAYFDFARDVTTLRGEQQQRRDELAVLRRQAQALVQTLPAPHYSGQQRMIEAEGTPLFGPKMIAAAGPAPVAAPPVAVPPAAPPVAPAVNPPQGNQQPANPPATQPTPATQPARPRVYIPPEKPSILDRQFNEPIPGPPPLPERPRYDDLR